MTDERNNEEADDFVSGAYRDLADERTPESLNRRILRMAARPARSGNRRKSLFAMGMKPLAWTATIGLSLAIVLEMTQVADFTGDEAALPAAAPASVSDQFSPQNVTVLEEAKEMARLRAGPNQATDAAVADEPVAGEVGKQADAGAPVPALAVTPPAIAPAVRSQGLAPAAGEARSRPDDQGFLQDSTSFELHGDRAEKQISANARGEEPRTPEQLEADAADHCERGAREAADSWFACIEKLRESGNFEDADRENEAFVLQYPDFLPFR